MKLSHPALLLALTLAVPALAAAQAKPAPARATHTAAKAAMTAPAPALATETTTGVVKSIDASTLMLTGARHKQMTFKLSADTAREGTSAAGARVSVRYRMDGASMVATAVTAQPVKGKKPGR
ncbi:MAG: hypothetical protein AB7N90_05845 [Vicinamibacterales bacterium]